MVVSLDSPLTTRVGKAAARRLEEGGLRTVRDLVEYAPTRYYTWGKLSDIGALEVGESATVLAQVLNQNMVRNRSGKGYRLLVDITDGNQALTITFFAKNPYMLNHHKKVLRPGETVLVSGVVGEYRGKLQMLQPEFAALEQDQEEEAAKQAGRPIPVYRSIGGLPSWKVGALITSLLDQMDLEELPEVLPPHVRARHGLLTYGQALEALHRPEEPVDWQSAKRSLAWAEALVLQTALLSRRVGAMRDSTQMALPLDGGKEKLDTALTVNLPFDLTGAQKAAWEEIGQNIAGETPMARLLQADVGAGKTVVALLAMTRAASSGHQAALLAPTEVLARQHYSSITRMLDDAGLTVPIHLVTASRPAKEKKAALAAIGAGEPSIVIGTHALLSEGVEIPDLAMLVVDEQHRFGVAQRDLLRTQKDHVAHLLVMTATPIPRTIALTAFGDLDVTTMDELPPGRQPVETHLVSAANPVWMNRVWQRAKEEVETGGRVFVVCPRIDMSEDEADEGTLDLGAGLSEGGVAAHFPAATEVHAELEQKGILKGIQVGLAHGRRRAEENAEAFLKFASGEAPILVATTVVEVGVDVPEATMMVVLGADRFGLSTLHQLRGRVGRSSTPSVCLLVSAPTENPVTKERLEAIAGTTDGFVLAQKDLELRKEGDVLGQAQAGHVSGLRFLSVIKDEAIIAGARQAGLQLLEEDPALSSAPGLRNAVLDRSGHDVVWLERT